LLRRVGGDEMVDKRRQALDEIIEDLRRVLTKCDQAHVAAVPAIYVDLAINLAMSERDRDMVSAA